MPYTDPESVHNPTTNAVIPASWGDAVDAAIQWIAEFAPNCCATRTTSLSISNASWTAVTMPTEEWDIGNMHSTSSNTSRLTVPTGAGGKYSILGEIEFAASATGFRFAAIRKNGVQVGGHMAVDPAGGSTAVSVSVVKTLALLPGDYVELFAYQGSGGALNVASARITASWERV